MANLSTSASCVADGRLGVSVSASVTQGGQSIDGNYTTVNYSYSASRSGSLGFIGTTRANAGSLVLIINGQTVVNVALPLSYGSNVGDGVTSGNGSVKVAHNADGSKTASIQLKIVAGSDPRGANYYWGNNSTSGSITLTNIPRASYPTVSASSKTLGETIVITTNRKSGNFTHSLWWICGDSGWQGIASGVGDSFSWTIPVDIAKRITSSTSATITIVCRTYSGSTQIGSDQTVTFTGNVPSDIKPSASGLSVSEAISAVKTKFGVYLKGQSKLAISFNEAGSYGSWITSRKIECNNQTFWSVSATTDYLYTSGSLKVTATVTDSRGRSSSVSTTVTVYDYGTPWVNALRSIRCSSDGTDTDDGEYLKIQFSAGVSSVSNKNSATYQLGYRLSNSGNYSYKTLDLTSLSYDGATTGVITGLTFAMDKTYDIVLVVTDKLGLEARRSDIVSTAFQLFNYYPDGSGVAIGKFAEHAKRFEVGITSEFLDALYTHQFKYVPTPIPNNADLNTLTYLKCGTYSIGTDKGAQSLKNCPTSSAFKMYVIDPNNDEMSFSNPSNAYTYFVRIIVGIYGFVGKQFCQSNGNKVVSYSAWEQFMSTGNILDKIYPVGSIYMSWRDYSPANFIGGTWERLKGGFLYGCVDSAGTGNGTGTSTMTIDLGNTGSTVLTVDQIPSHSHGQVVTANSGGSGVRRDWYSDANGALAYAQGVNTYPTGGGKGHTHTIPQHSHGVPYIAVFTWRRTA